MRGRLVWGYILGVAALKGLLFLWDPVPKFFFGDSYCYLETASSGWIPPDRSFTYGYLIKASTFLENSLWPLMGLQGVMGLGCALGLAYMLRRYLGVEAAWAGLVGVLCALEPIQLYYERSVMTECLSLFLFVAYLLACLRYLEKGELYFLTVLQFVGTCLISVRLSFLPMVLSLALILPLAKRVFEKKRGSLQFFPLSWKKGLCHLFFSLALTLIFHTAYKWSFAKLSGYPAGYAAATGYVLLATWAPVLEIRDFPDQELGVRLLESLSYDLRDPRLRNDHLFSPGGLVHRLRQIMPDEIQAEALARKTGMNAMARDPLGVLGLGVATFGDFFELDYLGKMIAEDLALHQGDEYSNFREVFKERLSMDLPEAQPMTWLRRYYQLAVPWYWALLCTPFACIWVFFRAPLEKKGAFFLLFWAALCALGSATFLAVQPVVRYLHPVAWLALALWGSLLLRRRPRSKAFISR